MVNHILLSPKKTAKISINFRAMISYTLKNRWIHLGWQFHFSFLIMFLQWLSVGKLPVKLYLEIHYWVSQSKSVFFKSHQNASLEPIIPNYPLDMNIISLSNKAEGV